MSGTLQTTNPYEKGWSEVSRSGACADQEIMSYTDRVFNATKDSCTFNIMFGPTTIGSGAWGAGTPSETSPNVPAWRARVGLALAIGVEPRIVTDLVRVVADGTTMLVQIVPAAGGTPEIHRLFLIDGVSGQKLKVYPADPEIIFAGNKASPQEIAGTGDWYVECKSVVESNMDKVDITTPAAVPSSGAIKDFVDNVKARARAVYLRE